MQNINELFKLLNTLLGSDEDFEIIHVEDGSFKVFIAASLLMTKIVSPLIDSISTNFSNIVDLIHKADMQSIEKELREEELRHLKSINKKKEELEDIKIDQEMLKLKKSAYEREIKNAEEALEIELNYKIKVLDKRYSEDFKHKDNTQMLLEQISKKIEDHFRHGGYIKTYLIENNHQTEKEKQFKERISVLSDQQLKLLEGPNKNTAKGKNKGK